MTTLLTPSHVDLRTSRDLQRALADARGSSLRAFSLIEVLLAIFILGVGVISIAALFPAGIAQQRASVDEIFGSTVASNALSLIRTKLKGDDFGTFEQFGVFGNNKPRHTINGDFTWMRPGFIFADDPGTANLDERGAIEIFTAGADVTASEFFPPPFNGAYPGTNPSLPPLKGIPYNTSLYRSAPRILISQTERYYPSATQNGTGDIARPQYVWDCMFRKFQGKVLVAIFVYRVTQPGGGNAAYVVAANLSTPTLPPLPIGIDLTVPAVQSTNCANGPWHAGGPDRDVATLADNTFVIGMPNGIAYNPDDQALSWQEPRQWILDQNDNIHRVLGVSRDGLNPQQIELVRAAPAVPSLGVYYIGAGVNPDVVSDIWYMPVAARDVNGDLLTLTPVYVTVKEL